MKKLVILEFIILIICSLSVFVLFDQKRSFQSELNQKERTVELNMVELKRLDDEREELAEKLEEIRNKEESKQLDLWRRRLEKLKEVLD
ncbi:MAG: hypothetical protein IKE50_01995 [Erysipelotrichaceae bacterium]|nr:hypothetical protein [Erysipelotrichaceae bacterium]